MIESIPIYFLFFLLVVLISAQAFIIHNHIDDAKNKILDAIKAKDKP